MDYVWLLKRSVGLGETEVVGCACSHKIAQNEIQRRHPNARIVNDDYGLIEVSRKGQVVEFYYITEEPLLSK